MSREFSDATKNQIQLKSALNTRNLTLNKFTLTTNNLQGPDSLASTQTNFEEVGLCSFNEFEIQYNILLCYMMAKDQK